jgi:hypothetical protein
VTAKHFVAGLIARDGIVVRAAPILRRFVGVDGRTFAAVCKQLGFTWEIVRKEVVRSQ